MDCVFKPSFAGSLRLLLLSLLLFRLKMPISALSSLLRRPKILKSIPQEKRNQASAMDTEKFTRTTKEALIGAHLLALNKGHAQANPLHLAISLLNDAHGLFRQAILNNSDATLASFDSVLANSLLKIPSQSPPPDSVPASTSLGKVVRRAQRSQKSRGDTHLAVDLLILSLLKDSQIAGCFKEAGLSVRRVRSWAEKLRGKGGKKVESAEELKTYGRDLVEQAGKLDPVIGGYEEIRRVITILSRRKNNNPILIGEPGVGRTSVVEGLARRIARGDVPSNLPGMRLFALDMGALMAGAEYRGRFEERLKSVIREAEEEHVNTILFIDDIHLILGARRCGGSMHATNLLKPVLARGLLMCIGATTSEEYRKYVEKDADFERLFQKVYVAEPSVSVAINILRGLKMRCEEHHGVRIRDRALVAAVEVSYITGWRLPDKAIDMVDEACANVRVHELDGRPEEIDKLERKRIQLKVELHALEEEEKDEASKARLLEVKMELDDLRAELIPLKMRYMREKERVDEIRTLKQSREDLLITLQEAERMLDLDRVSRLKYGALHEIDIAIAKKLDGDAGDNFVGPEQIAEVVSPWTGTPMTRLGQNDKERPAKRVVGQDQAVGAVGEAKLQPSGPVIFLGPTRVGKTELAKI